MKTLRTLLVPIDGSEASAPAVDYALWLAHNEGAEIEFCHSVDITNTLEACTMPYYVADIGPIVSALEDESKSLLAAAQGRAKAYGVAATGFELAGPPAGAIVEAAQRHGVSAIVMGSHGRSGASRFFLGSVAEGVLRQTDLPVFVISHPGTAGGVAPSTVSDIVVALDDSDPADAAVDFALSLADPERTTIELVHILHLKTLHQMANAQRYDIQRRFAEERAASQRLLDAAADRLCGHVFKVEKTLVEGAPVEEILSIAEHRRADLIVIGTHGRRGLQRLFLGSVAEDVVRSANVPVAVVRRRMEVARSESTPTPSAQTAVPV